MKITPVILAGGFGTRLWPVSRQSKPKQFSSFFGDKSLFQKTILRFNDPQKFSKSIIICNNEHRFMVASQLDEIKTSARTIILEPSSRNTAGAIASVAHIISKNNADEIMLICPADHLIDDVKNFTNAVYKNSKLALEKFFITFGIKPKYPETGFGYILKSSPIEGGNAFMVDKFIEKPNAQVAEKLLENPNCYWNSGIFLFSARTYLETLKILNNEIFETTKNAVASAQKDLDFIRLEAKEYEKCPNISIDYAIMEKAQNIALAPLNTDWSDVGSWQTLHQLSDKNSDQNYIEGQVATLKTTNCYIRSEGPLVACLGVNNLIIIATKDVFLVANIKDSQSIKELFEIVKNSYSQYCLNHQTCIRPWGSFEIIDAGINFKVKKILVNPHSALSLQKHNQRAEHWVVVRGIASITRENEYFELKENESTFIPLGHKHRLENKTNDILEIIEIQSGSYLEEDDIQRFRDNYGRNKNN
ncbi:MAG: mannose-1-phosphate guanylyltransferase/mannose-6-phosphate isomerase [Proteobacteria bacterium]|nr:mannose-1-phosphate guanylyltransferase/mannose-6-phosphate isomerase [Pseudomonadota bacterium]NCA28530.1 mannose-1-phosphate guanylyltransferase/mannose-6-phosphate isomerase [Pseudomonadota bacterium]